MNDMRLISFVVWVVSSLLLEFVIKAFALSWSLLWVSGAAFIFWLGFAIAVTIFEKLGG